MKDKIKDFSIALITVISIIGIFVIFYLAGYVLSEIKENAVYNGFAYGCSSVVLAIIGLLARASN